MRPGEYLRQQPTAILQNNKRARDGGPTGDLKRPKLGDTKVPGPTPAAQPAELEILTVPGRGSVNQATPLNQHTDYGNGLLHVRAGQPVRLMVRAAGQQVQLGNVQWVVGGAAVGQCVQSPQKGAAPELTDAARAATLITIIWVSPGTHAVTVTATVGNKLGTCTAMVKVIVPSVDVFTYSTANVSLCGDGQFGRHEGSFLALYEPAEPKRFGCTWNATVSAVEETVGQQRFATAGQVGFIQVCCFSSGQQVAKPSREGFAREGSYLDDSTAEYLEGGLTALDASLNEMLYCPAKPLAQGRTVTFGPDDGGQDSPATKLNQGIVRVTEDNKFRTYLVYKCDVLDSIWVTLAYADWSWEAKICRQGWEPRQGDAQPAEKPTDGPWQQPTGIKVTPLPHQLTHGTPVQQGGPGNMPTWNERADALVARKVRLLGT
jgi:hypothetical protein